MSALKDVVENVLHAFTHSHSFGDALWGHVYITNHKSSKKLFSVSLHFFFCSLCWRSTEILWNGTHSSARERESEKGKKEQIYVCTHMRELSEWFVCRLASMRLMTLTLCIHAVSVFTKKKLKSFKYFFPNSSIVCGWLVELFWHYRLSFFFFGAALKTLTN